MPIENYVRVTHYPDITIDDFKSPNQDDRYLIPLKNLFDILDQLHIRYVYVTATVIRFLLNFPNLGVVLIRKEC